MVLQCSGTTGNKISLSRSSTETCSEYNSEPRILHEGRQTVTVPCSPEQSSSSDLWSRRVFIAARCAGACVCVCAWPAAGAALRTLYPSGYATSVISSNWLRI